MKEIWFIRYAESASNAGLKTTDSEKIPITELGTKQAEELVKTIDREPDLIIYTKFLRTLQTAAPTIEKFSDVPVEILPLHEFDFLAKENCTDLNVEQRKPMVQAYWNRSDADYVDGKGAESFNTFYSRVIESLKAIESREEKFILVFTHGHVIRAIRHYFSTKSNC